MISVKLVTLDLLKMKVFWSKGYDVIVSVHDVTNKIILRDANWIVDVVMWPKFGRFYERSYKFIMIWPEKQLF